MLENSHLDKKSLRLLTKPNVDWDEIAKDCVCFANALGGSILYGIEDLEDQPPENQQIPENLPSLLVKQIQGRTINVSVLPVLKTSENGGEYLELKIQRNAASFASTSTGRYYIRVEDSCKPVLPDELLRLMSDKTAFNWETSNYLKVHKDNYNHGKFLNFTNQIKDSDRVTNFVKSKSPDELLEHYLFVSGDYLTNLGVLWIGNREHRAKLLYAPAIQFLKFDENDQRVSKKVWDDYGLNPQEMIASIWDEIAEWKEGIEIADGLYRKTIQNYDETVIREILANALVHRPYTIRGDIFINYYTNKIEVHNPGLLPLGVTPENILHKSVQRNPHLAKVFYDLKLMEKEGSGFDRMYETLLANGKPLPKVIEKDDRVTVSVSKRIVNKQIIKFIESVSTSYQLKQKELISLGLIAQHNALISIEFCKILGLRDDDSMKSWLGRLLEFKLLKTTGKTKGTSYYIEPALLIKHSFRGNTTLKKIEPHRLKYLVLEDIERFGKSSISEIHTRIGAEIPIRSVRYQIEHLIKSNEIGFEGDRKWRRYFIDKKI